MYACFGGMSNTGIVTALASIEAVKELGLRKAAIGCLGRLPTNVLSVLGKTRTAKKIVTVDCCSFECSKKIVENSGFKVSKNIVLVRDIGMKKKALHEDVGRNLGLASYVSEDDVRRAKELIIKAVMED
ncbi:MAG: putative zinc-binding protein [Candidatus Bathyarchaeia archaeon]